MSSLKDLEQRIEADPATREAWAALEPSRDVATLFVALRHLLGLTQAELGERAGVSQARIAQLESGIANPTVQTLSRTLRSVGVRLRVTSEVVFADRARSEASAAIDESADANQLTEGERIVLAITGEAIVAALQQARVDGKPFSAGAVATALGEVDRQLGKPSQNPRTTGRLSAGSAAAGG